MTDFSNIALSELTKVARRVNWFEPPDSVITNERRFLCSVMQFGTIEDILVARRYFGDKAFRDALDHAEAGEVDHRSWTYWNLVLNDNHDRAYPIRRLPT